MKCYRCRREISEYQWITRSDKGYRHLTCPNPNGKRAAQRRRQLERYLGGK